MPTYIQENTSFSRSRYEVQGRRQPESSGAQFWSGGTEEARSKGKQRIVGEGAASLPPHQLRCLGERCKLPQRGPGRSPGRWIFFLAFCATRLPLLASQYTLAAVCWAVYAYMIATHFHDTPYILMHLGAPYVLRWHGPWGNVPTPPMRLCIYSPLFRHTACFSVIP